jgi:hypothetical protein
MPCLAGIPSSALAQEREFSSIPLLEFNPPSWSIPENPILGFSAQDNSPGISFPYSAYKL